jgi:hypothetical protein
VFTVVANRYTIRLYHYGDLRKQVDTNLDPADDSRLRELLEQQVKAVAGTLRLDLSAGWKLVVLREGGGQIKATATVDRSGRTVVKR